MDIQAWSVENWNKIPEADRKRCLDHLRTSLEGEHGGAGCLARWRAQVRSTFNGEPVAIGSDDIWFHFGAGMAVRNILRQVMPDHRLPVVEYPNNRGLVSNWDDYYLGAIHALASEPETKPLLDRLRRWLALKIGDPFPPEMEANGWGNVLHQDITDAIAEIEMRRGVPEPT